MWGTVTFMDVLADEPQETRDIWEFVFFLDTMGMCRMYPIDSFFPVFFFICHSCLVFLSFSKELRDGPNQNQSYLTISLLYFYLLEFYFNVRRCSEEKNQDVWWTTSDYLGGLFSFICLLLIVILISSQEWIIEAVAQQWLKRHFNM